MESNIIQKKKYIINIALIGDSGVGKTSLVNRLVGKPFDNNNISTIGIGHDRLLFERNKQLPNSIIELYFWDTAGQERYRSLCNTAVKKADIIIFVRDETKSHFEDYDGKPGWIQFVEDNLNIELPEKKIFFCLNKTDKISEEKKNEINEELENLAQLKNANAEVFLISCKSSDGIINLLNKIKNFSSNIILDHLKHNNHEINICLFGDSMVGKSSLINRLINDEYMESTIATVNILKHVYYHVDIKSNYDIKYNYYDLPGQKQLLNDKLNIFTKVDIIIFVSERENLKIKFEIIEKKIVLSKKILLFCINKDDLIPIGGRAGIQKKYKSLNKGKVPDDPIFISCLNGKGINDLKNKILQLGSEIIEQRTKKDNSSEKNTTVSRNNINLNKSSNESEEKNKKAKKKCCSDK